MTQAELADGRFSKEYISQIERGKTRPRRATLEWLADRLATDSEFLESGLTRATSQRIETAIRSGERLAEERRYGEALRAFESARVMLHPRISPAISQRLLRGQAWAQIRSGDLDGALTTLEEAAALVVRPGFTEVDRAEIVFLVGVVRTSQSRIAEAIVLLNEALLLAESSGLPSDRLRSDIFHWRARCHRASRDWVAAHEDTERALELAEACSDTRRIADALFQASLGAQRDGRWLLARNHAERSRALFEELGDRATVGRLLNNLAGLEHLLGNVDQAIALLRDGFEIFVELDLAVDAGYVCSSLAEILVEASAYKEAEQQARKALDLLEGRSDHVQEIGTAQLALGRALAGQERLSEAESWTTAAETTFEQANLVSHRSYAWLAQGDIESRRGNDRAAARLFRSSALALLDEDTAPGSLPR